MRIQANISLLPYNTFHLDCTAEQFCEISSIQDIHDLLTFTDLSTTNFLVLWWGSNILLTQPTYTWLVIKNNILGKEITEQSPTHTTLTVWAGENRNEFVLRAIDQWYTGIENLISIPGNVWAAPMQNIWAYGVEVKDTIVSVSGIYLLPHRDHQPWDSFTLTSQQCEFGYRESIFKHALKGKLIITHVTFKLEIYSPESYTPNLSYGKVQEELDNASISTPTPGDIATTIAAIRASKLPDWTEIGTAGSFFKNPIISNDQRLVMHDQFPSLRWFPQWDGTVKLSAGQLIDLAWCKGLQHGNVCVYHLHALVLTNPGNGTGEELVQLAEIIQDRVEKKFGILLNPEVNFVS